VTVGTYIGVRVLSQQGITLNYYRFRVTAGTGSAATITGASVNGATVALPAVGTSVGAAGITVVNNLAASSLNPLTIAVTGLSTGATVRYGSAAPAATGLATAPTIWNTTGVFANFTNFYTVSVEVTSADLSTVNFYNFKIVLANSPSTVATISAATLNGTSVGTIPAPATSWAGITNTPLVVITGLPANVTVAATPAAGATVTWGYSANGTTQPTWGTTTPLANVALGSYIGIRVIAQSGVETAYYRYRIAAGIGEGAEITGVTIDGLSATLPAPGATWNAGLATTPVEVADLSSFTISASGASAGATVTWGTTDRNTALPATWVTTSPLTDVASGTFIGVRVVAGTGLTTNYYRFQVTETAVGGE
jgi:hypothetical protein